MLSSVLPRKKDKFFLVSFEQGVLQVQEYDIPYVWNLKKLEGGRLLIKVVVPVSLPALIPVKYLSHVLSSVLGDCGS